MHVKLKPFSFQIPCLKSAKATLSLQELLTKITLRRAEVTGISDVETTRNAKKHQPKNGKNVVVYVLNVIPWDLKSLWFYQKPAWCQF